MNSKPRFKLDLEGLDLDFSLSDSEIYWREHYDWLYQCGYELRPRYHPDWVPSWVRDPELKMSIPWCEDSVRTVYSNLMDATRIRDGYRVMLKRVDWSIHPHEAAITYKLSQDDWGSDARNHAVPLLDLLEPPHDGERDIFILVMPLLSRDIHALNTMIDARLLCPEEVHPVRQLWPRSLQGIMRKSTRTEHPVRYYIIDFGISRLYSAEDLPPLEYPISGIDRTVPEFKNPSIPQNPFPTDIYYLGNMIREQFILGTGGISTPGFYGFDFLLPLVLDMVQDDPRNRPTIDEVIDRFSIIVNKLSWWKLRSRLVPRSETASERRRRTFKHIIHTITYIYRGLPAIPQPLPI
ncbi:hypothetical protein D9613_000141 [Agrocybe pediades]|uniref:Protein kinase domain-containing protein n=1 Tax=Agrocybe pediades TaxID=84607 RepID=A0A8H4VSE6_9AGAR|nr:hypothetical protein D9613_000141 [Agrocybe pediades]